MKAVSISPPTLADTTRQNIQLLREITAANNAKNKPVPIKPLPQLATEGNIGRNINTYA